MGIFAIILAVVTALPKLILDIEALFGHGTGAAKKQAVLDATSTALDAAATVGVHEITPTTTDAVLTAVGSVTDAIVASLNAVGVFTHGGSTPSTPQA